MNCREFESVLPELRNKKEEGVAPLAKSAKEHARLCPGCRVRLSDEQSLRAGLEILALNHRSQTAPPSVQQRLWERLREIDASQESAVAGTNKKVNGPAAIDRDASQTSYRKYLSIGAAAAVLIVLIALTLIRMWQVPDPPAAPSASLTVAVPSGSLLNGGNSTVLGTSQVSKFKTLARHQDSPGSRLKTQGQRPAISKPSQAMGGPRVASRVEKIQSDGFLPLFAVAAPPALDQTQIVRVRLQRSALYPFGLPVDLERDAEAVQADVLLGEDGVAVAVRLVH